MDHITDIGTYLRTHGQALGELVLGRFPALHVECRIGCFSGRRSDFRSRMRPRHQRSGRSESDHNGHASASQLCLGISHDESFSVGVPASHLILSRTRA